MGLLGIAAASTISYQLGPSDRGEIGVLLVVVSFAITAGALGVGESFVVLLARAAMVRRSQVVRLSLLASVLAGALGFLGGLWFARITQAPDALVCAVFCASAASTTNFWRIPSQSFLAQHRLVAWNVSRIGGNVTWLAAVLIGIRLIGSQPGENPLLYIGVAYAAGNTLLGLALLTARQRDGTVATDLSKDRVVVKSGLPMAGASLLALLTVSMDRIYASLVLTPSELGQYVAAFAYGTIVTLLIQSAGGYAFTTLSAKHLEDQPSALSRLLVIANSAGLYAAFVASIGAYPAVLLLNGFQFQEAARISWILVVSGAVSGVMTIVSQGMKATGHSMLAVLLEVLRILMLIATLITFNATTPASIATATAFSALVTLLLSFILVARASGVPIATTVRILGPVSLMRRTR